MCTWLVRQRCTTLPQAGVNILYNRLKAYNYFFKQIIFLNSTWNTFQEYCGVLKFIYQFCSGQAVCPSCPDFWAQAFEGNCPNNDRIIVIPCKALFMRFCPDLALILLDFVQNLPGFGLFFFLQIELGLRIGHTVAEATFLGKLLQTGLIIFTQA